MRNPNGYGTVFKLSGKNRRRPYVAKVTVGFSEEGKQLYEVIGYFETKPDAMIALAEYHKGGVKPGTSMTLSDVYNEWSKIKFDTISQSMIRQYHMAWNYLDKLKNTKFTDLRTAHLQKVINECSSTLKRGSLGKIKVLLDQLYSYAMQNDIVIKNYAEYIKLPKEAKTEKEIFTDLEIQKFWDNLDMPFVDSILFLIYTGMRLGEMLQLTPFNIDLEAQTITGGLKTDAGRNRVIPIHPKIMPIVKAKMCQEQLFPYDSAVYRARFYEVLNALNMPKRTPHSTRHTFITLMSRGGADVVALQKIVGHANYSTTADVYTHTDLDDLRKAMKSI